ncbi:IclR family transcriptional regulator [Sphingomonas sp. 37zxx]|uniref:IclR family transcriptional regulator n=1 Tax=Sphingomonas sp. 37zxx TaxID=1550073 RepID=UPI00053BEE0D|nr:IclR family transcriptional regulator [Sphingomonas sp. 37zxx]
MNDLASVAVPAEAPLDDDRRYKAPALEKGLDILELLAAEAEPLTLTGIVHRLGRSHGELFRMVQVLEYRGYLEQDPVSDGYRLTDRLFSLGIQQPRTRNLIELALPIMRQVASECGQACHLALHSQGEMVVVARMESSEQIGFSVRVGYRKPLMQAASGLVLYAFQPDDVRARWEALLAPKPKAAELAAFRASAQEVREKRLGMTPSKFVAGVFDISAPVMRGGAAAAALTMPYLETLQPRVSKEHAARIVCAAADSIALQLVEGDSRV